MAAQTPKPVSGAHTLLIARDFPPDVGGVQTVLDQLARRWPGHLTVIAGEESGAATHDAAYPRPIHRIRRFDAWPRPIALLLRQLAVLATVIRLSRREKFDRVLCGYIAFAGPTAWLWSRATGRPYVVLTYGNDLLRLDKSPARAVWRRLLTDAQVVSTIADIFTDYVRRFAPGAKPVKIPMGCIFERADAPPLPEPFHGVPLTGKRVLLSVGRLVTRKGHDMALRALPILRTTYDDLVYVIVGDGPDRARLESLADELRVSDMVVFAGRASARELAALYAAASVFVMPSRQIGEDVEGFGLVFLEAGYHRVPVVGGNSGGIPEAVREGENGLLADPADPTDIAAKVARLLDDPALASRMGDAGRRLATEHFTFARMVGTLVEAVGA